MIKIFQTILAGLRKDVKLTLMALTLAVLISWEYRAKYGSRIAVIIAMKTGKMTSRKKKNYRLRYGL